MATQNYNGNEGQHRILNPQGSSLKARPIKIKVTSRLAARMALR
jgi:hypothetical protein